MAEKVTESNALAQSKNIARKDSVCISMPSRI